MAGCRTGSAASLAASQPASGLRPSLSANGRLDTPGDAYRRLVDKLKVTEGSELKVPGGDVLRTAFKAARLLIDALLEARDLLAQFFYFVFEISLPASHPGVAGFEEGF